VTRDEADTNLELMPRAVRDKLDRVRLKVHLKEWQALSLAERARLRDLPCSTEAELQAYAVEVDALVRRVTGKPTEKLHGA